MSIEEDTKGVLLRFSPELLDRVDAWKLAQGQGLSRRSAILRLIEYGLGTNEEMELRINAEVERRVKPRVLEGVTVVKEELRERIREMLL